MAKYRYVGKILTASVFLRIFFALRLSYIHPDEHLQGPQVIAHGLFGWASQTPWEFETASPIRSFVPLWLFYGIPMSLIPEGISPKYIIYTLRLMFALMIWIFNDMAIDRLTLTRGRPILPLMLSATSYVTWTYQSHTFSNSIETVLVLWFLVILHEFQVRRRDPFDRYFDNFLLGIIVVLGTFNRPTFIAWLAIPGLSLLQFWVQHPTSIIPFILGFALAFCIFVDIDTIVYDSKTWVLTPLNNFLYNTNSENLSSHGTHSRWQHLLCNIPQLLGPGLLLIRPRWTLPMQAAVGGILLHSLVPHQEARFLIPVVPLLITAMDTSFWEARKLKDFILTLWVGYNLVLGILMGAFHQAGVLPAEIWLSQNAVPCQIVWWKTYTPPLYVMGLDESEVLYADKTQGYDAMAEVLSGQGNYTRVVDLMGAPTDLVSSMLNFTSKPAYFVAPFASQHQQFTKGHDLVWSTFVHINLDLIDFSRPSSLQPGLGVWLVK